MESPPHLVIYFSGLAICNRGFIYKIAIRITPADSLNPLSNPSRGSTELTPKAGVLPFQKGKSTVFGNSLIRDFHRIF